MALGGQELVDLAARTLFHQVRQVSTTLASPASDPIASSTLAPSSTGLPSTSPTFSSDPPPTSTGAGDAGSGQGSGNNSGNSGNSGSSPLLFFVALGFGVVFTNLW